jgi:hypothetical protein
MSTHPLSLFFPAQVNEYAARLVAALVSALLSLSVVFDARWLVGVVALGFLARVAWGPRFSLAGRGAVALAARLWSTKLVMGAPKRFAQGIGTLCTLGALLSFAVDKATLAWALSSMVAAFAFLEAALGFCMGCWLYARLQRVGVFPAEACSDCARP